MRLKVEGAELNVEIDGAADAPAVMLWGGAYCTTRMWDKVVPRLAQQFRVIRFDVRGTGQSGPATDESLYSLERYAEDAAAILDELGIERTIVWSMAWGSRAAVVFAARKPERVILLALYDASVHRADVEAQGEGRRKAFALQEAAGIPLIERPDGWNEHRDRDSARQGYSAAGRFEDLPAELDKIKVPTLVATGDNDPNLVSSRKIVERLANAELVVMKNVGHGSVLQRPDLTTDVFLEFVAKQQAN